MLSFFGFLSCFCCSPPPLSVLHTTSSLIPTKCYPPPSPFSSLLYASCLIFFPVLIVFSRLISCMFSILGRAQTRSPGACRGCLFAIPAPGEPHSRTQVHHCWLTNLENLVLDLLFIYGLREIPPLSFPFISLYIPLAHSDFWLIFYWCENFI